MLFLVFIFVDYGERVTKILCPVAMLYGHANRVSRLYCLLLVIGLIKVGWFHPQNDVKDFRHSALDTITQAARRDEFSPSLGCATLTNNRRHLGLDKLTVNGYSNARVSRYSQLPL